MRRLRPVSGRVSRESAVVHDCGDAVVVATDQVVHPPRPHGLPCRGDAVASSAPALEARHQLSGGDLRHPHPWFDARPLRAVLPRSQVPRGEDHRLGRVLSNPAAPPVHLDLLLVAVSVDRQPLTQAPTGGARQPRQLGQHADDAAVEQHEYRPIAAAAADEGGQWLVRTGCRHAGPAVCEMSPTRVDGRSAGGTAAISSAVTTPSGAPSKATTGYASCLLSRRPGRRLGPGSGRPAAPVRRGP